jgi:hypothetical protein
MPGLLTVIGIQEESLEKRKQNEIPALPENFETLRKFPSLFEDYFRDHMGLKIGLNKLYSKVLLSLGTSPVEKVLLGKEDWLFYAGERVISDFQNTALFNEEQLKIWGDSLAVRQKALAEKGIDYLFVIPPNKHTIYSEYLPDYLARQQTRSRFDQLIDYLEKHTDVNFLDLRPALLDAKKSKLLYWARDTHWNRIGAAVAQKALADKLSEMGYSATSEGTDFENWNHTYKRNQDLSRLLGGVREIEEQGHSYDLKELPCKKSFDYNETWGKDKKNSTHVLVSNCPSKEHKMLMFRDSFSNELVPFLSNYFHEAKYIWTLPDEETFKFFLSSNIDIVIEERVERKLQEMPKPQKWAMNLDKLEQKDSSNMFAESSKKLIF